MKEGKWHFRKIRGRWQGVKRVGHSLKVRWLPLNCPAFWLMPQHGDINRVDY